jgi:hypothetical protein
MTASLPWRCAVAFAVAGAFAGLLVSCSDHDSPAGAAASTTASTTTVPLAYRAAIAGDHELPGHYRQGLARVGDGWVISTDNGLYRVDETLAETRAADGVIPADLAAQGFDHVGDIDIAGGVLWAPLERPDRDAGQVMARYDPETLAFVGSEPVDQHHAAFVTVDDEATVYSVDQFATDDTVLRYRWTGERLSPVEPLHLSRALDRIQGGDVADGALWLSTDDATNGLYRVDLATGEVTALGSAGRVPGEGEGLDAADVPAGPLRVLVADQRLVPMWLVDLTVTSSR